MSLGFRKISTFSLLLGLFPYTSLVAEGFADAGLSLNRNNNIANAQFAPDTFSDSHYDLNLTLGRFSDLDDGLSMTYFAQLSHSDYQDWSGFSHTDLTANFELNKKLGLGAFVPSVGGKIIVEQQSYEDDVRDQAIWQLNLFWKKRLSEIWDLKIDIGLLDSEADNARVAGPLATDPGGPNSVPGIAKSGDAFSVTGQSLSAEAGVALNDSHWLTMTYQLIDGEVVSSARPEAGIISAATAITADPAIGDGFFAYRVDAKTQSLGVAWDMVLNDDWSLTTRVQRIDSKAKNWPVEYDKTLSSLQLTMVF